MDNNQIRESSLDLLKCMSYHQCCSTQCSVNERSGVSASQIIEYLRTLISKDTPKTKVIENDHLVCPTCHGVVKMSTLRCGHCGQSLFKIEESDDK